MTEIIRNAWNRFGNRLKPYRIFMKHLESPQKNSRVTANSTKPSENFSELTLNAEIVRNILKS